MDDLPITRIVAPMWNRQNCRTIALPCFQRTRAPIDLWCRKGVRLGKMRLDVDVSRRWLSSAAELNSLGIQINAPTISPPFRHVFPLLPSSTLSFFHRLALPMLFLSMNFITVRVSTGNVSVHMSLHLCMSAYNSWSVSQCIHVHSCTAYNALSLQRPEVTDRARSREEYLEER